jgi:hypothetical protein
VGSRHLLAYEVGSLSKKPDGMYGDPSRKRDKVRAKPHHQAETRY